ncbi:glycerophosphodiester phosphodiesterase [Halarcobacter ebronensis]|uniref:glycerophosphodiester phosphodiesterase n=1 Tax=Halarcobacter ebronensis TaxID=1462615 RepID=A0A4Q0YH33_9BACT|nr:glycerophosphodiester phosphodiesterase family protein [Halarcobacter ebronensis]RXJ69014.1 glycerophosphodiester phosphodiesterase [Halarcobacter ebronensis]
MGKYAKIFFGLVLAFFSFAFAQENIQLGVRPYYLVEDMDEGTLKKELQACVDKTPSRTLFSIGHRGAPLQFPEHTKESYMAAAKMGAGILECDVAFTKDKELVCRHSQCDLHTTTNILATPLAKQCTKEFTPAVFDKDGKLIKEASALCCTSDITLEQFKSLKGKMDSEDKSAKTVEEYMNSTPSWRTDLYTQNGTLMTHKESIELFKKLGVKMTPELKTPSVKMPFDGNYTQQIYAQQMINEYKEAGVKASDVFAQSFDIEDIKYWIKNEPEFAKQAVYLDDDVYEEKDGMQKQIASMKEFSKMGIKYIAPPLQILVTLDENKKIVPSKYALEAQKYGIGIITWSMERSGPLKNGGGWYYSSIKDAINNDGDMYELIDVLAQKVKVKAIFSDWPATITYYANCKGL